MVARFIMIKLKFYKTYKGRLKKGHNFVFVFSQLHRRLENTILTALLILVIEIASIFTLLLI